MHIRNHCAFVSYNVPEDYAKQTTVWPAQCGVGRLTKALLSPVTSSLSSELWTQKVHTFRVLPFQLLHGQPTGAKNFFKEELIRQSTANPVYTILESKYKHCFPSQFFKTDPAHHSCY